MKKIKKKKNSMNYKTASIRIKFLYLTEMLAALRDYFGSKNHSSRVFKLRACRLDVESFLVYI